MGLEFGARLRPQNILRRSDSFLEKGGPHVVAKPEHVAQGAEPAQGSAG